MSIKDEVLRYIKENKNRFEKEYGIKKIYLFGSVARGEDNENSDIDLMVEFDTDKNITIFELMMFEEEMKNKFGRKVDVATKDMLKPIVYNYVQKDLLNVK
ncbi:nucleotidyltransferase family protein [Caminibacter pacificus]|uniref:Nucleotidyltransferase family protein n=1 Tax=Caminibacter pacificus TaxID=1424653 RepID=A0AAJ4UXH2_9BACT|nr:nucleotidyltransferase family protein [Caminibacter pacificus]QCI29052.1 nucleotidyltransferase family protein [Caminibacter pacificus]ROR39130.1 hypothetical protein EDC58_1628 [Caminibacter pacificus]